MMLKPIEQLCLNSCGLMPTKKPSGLINLITIQILKYMFLIQEGERDTLNTKVKSPMTPYVIDLNLKQIVNTLEKIVGGDGRFSMVQGNAVPEFSG